MVQSLPYQAPDGKLNAKPGKIDRSEFLFKQVDRKDLVPLFKVLKAELSVVPRSNNVEVEMSEFDQSVYVCVYWKPGVLDADVEDLKHHIYDLANEYDCPLEEHSKF